jgi:hypothetical protein
VIRRHKHQGQHPECHQMCLAGALAQLTVMSARFCLGAEVMYVRQWLCGSVQNCTLAQKRWHDNLHNRKIHTSSAQCKSHFDTSGGCIETHFFRRTTVRVLATPGRYQGPSGPSRKNPGNERVHTLVSGARDQYIPGHMMGNLATDKTKCCCLPWALIGHVSDVTKGRAIEGSARGVCSGSHCWFNTFLCVTVSE